MPDRYRTGYEPRQEDRYRYDDDDRYYEPGNRESYREQGRSQPWESFASRGQGARFSREGRSMDEARRASEYMEGRRSYGAGRQDYAANPYGGSAWEEQDYPGGYRPGEYGYGDDYRSAEAGPRRWLESRREMGGGSRMQGSSTPADYYRESGRSPRYASGGEWRGNQSAQWREQDFYGTSASRMGGQGSQWGDYYGTQSARPEYGRQSMDYGEHVGKGPKGWKRSDDRIKEEVCEHLCDEGAVDASDINVSVMNGDVTLSGNVNDRWQKRRAEDAISSLPGVNDINNQLRIGGSPDRSTQPATSEMPGTASNGSPRS